MKIQVSWIKNPGHALFATIPLTTPVYNVSNANNGVMFIAQ